MSVDNLYLDMNGIIHTCSHSNDFELEAGEKDEDMARKMCTEVEKLFNVVKPKKNFVLCVDGVAPRAKMNQQRQRRFRKESDMLTAIEEAAKEGTPIPDADSLFDSNMISPGTEFMELFCEHFKFFLQRKLQVDACWRGVNVVFSGHDAPGEGEHKIMDFMRARKESSDYHTDEVHCLYGLDADLIMLSLASQERHIVLLREIVKFESMKDIAARKESLKSRGITNESSLPASDQYVLFQIGCFRDYLRLDMAGRKPVIYNNTSINWDTCYRDYVLMSCIVGNDFLPHLPHMAIKNNAMQLLVDRYSRLLQRGQYLTEGNVIHWENLRKLLEHVGQAELQQCNAAASHHQPSVKSILPTKKQHYKAKLNMDWDNFDSSQTGPIKDLCTSWVEGVRWVWEYYTTGVPSWSWYYPYHYGPYVSDLARLDLAQIAADTVFTVGQPLLPFQQLFSVLPPLSIARGLPKAYHTLHKEKHLEYAFPERLEVDRDEATAPWEGVVVIPFLSENDVLVESQRIASTFTADEVRRNTNRFENHYRFDENAPPRVLRSLLAGVEDVTATVAYDPSFTPDKLKTGGPLKRTNPQPGRAVGCASLFDDLKEVCAPMNERGPVFEKNSSVSIFGRTSFKPSLIIHIRDIPASELDRLRPEALLGKWTWVDWPNPRLGKVTKVITHKTTTHLTQKNSVKRAHNDLQQRQTDLLFQEHSRKLLEKRGLLVKITAMVAVVPLVGVSASNSVLERKAGEHELLFPLQLMPAAPYIHSTMPQLDAVGKKAKIEVQGPLIYLPKIDGSDHVMESLAGTAGVVKSVDALHTVVTMQQSLHPPPVAPQAFLESIDMSRWASFQELADKLRCDCKVVHMVAGSIVTTEGFGKREIGLCLYLRDTSQVRAGFAKLSHAEEPLDISHYMSIGAADCAMSRVAAGGRKGGAPGPALAISPQTNKWLLLSPQAQGIVKEFLELFPVFKEVHCDWRDFDPNQLLHNTNKSATEIMDEVSAFSSRQAHWGARFVSASEELLSEDIMLDMERTIRTNTELFHAAKPPAKRTKRLKMQADSRLMDFYTPFLSVSNITHLTHSRPYHTNEIFRLGGRVVNMNISGPVPFGARGTVTRLLSDMVTVEVVMDEEHFGCTRLGGRILTYRGLLARKRLLLPVPSRPVATDALEAPVEAPPAVVWTAPRLSELPLSTPLPVQGRPPVECDRVHQRGSVVVGVKAAESGGEGGGGGGGGGGRGAVQSEKGVCHHPHQRRAVGSKRWWGKKK